MREVPTGYNSRYSITQQELVYMLQVWQYTVLASIYVYVEIYTPF